LGLNFFEASTQRSMIERNPDVFPVIFGQARRAVVRRFPFSVIYTVFSDEILVVACVHGRRDPAHWQKRL
jgi:hypothetical protein